MLSARYSPLTEIEDKTLESSQWCSGNCLLHFYEVGNGTTHSGYRTTPVGCRGGNRYVERDLLTFGYLLLDDTLPSLTIGSLMLDDTFPSLTIGYLMLDDCLGVLYYRLFNVG